MESEGVRRKSTLILNWYEKFHHTFKYFFFGSYFAIVSLLNFSKTYVNGEFIYTKSPSIPGI